MQVYESMRPLVRLLDFEMGLKTTILRHIRGIRCGGVEARNSGVHLHKPGRESPGGRRHEVMDVFIDPMPTLWFSGSRES